MLKYFFFFFFLSCASFPRISFYPGTSDPSIKNYQVAVFFNQTPSAPADISVQFTEALRDFLQRNTSLEQVNENADLEFSGVIEGYQLIPVAPAGNDQNQTAQLQRLVISVKVQFLNHSNPKQNFDKVISNFADFDANQILADIEQDLIPEIFNNIIQEIFNQSIAVW